MSGVVTHHQQQQQPMKVRIIETQFVETDAIQFKMVVQKFTGKNSVVMSKQRSTANGRRQEEEVEKVCAGRKRELQLAKPAAPAMAAAAVAAEGELDVWPTYDELYELLGA